MKSAKQQRIESTPDSTLPGLLKKAASARGGKAWMRKKYSGLWHEYSWSEAFDRVRQFSLGLASLGFEPGQSVCIIGDTDPQWLWSELAIQAGGGTPIALGPAMPAADIGAVVNKHGARFAIVRDKLQVDKLVGIAGTLKTLTRIIYWNPKGIEADEDPLLTFFDGVAESGKALELTQSGQFEERLGKVAPSATAIIAYTAAGTDPTTMSHAGLLHRAQLFSDARCRENDSCFCSLPLDEMPGQLIELGASLLSGMRLDFPESQETAQADLREIGSTLICYPSPVWEALISSVMDRVKKTSFTKRMMARMAAPVGSRVAVQRRNGRKPGPALGLAAAAAEFGFYHPLKARIGLANIREALSLGPQLSPGALKSLLEIGLPIRQIEGSPDGEGFRVAGAPGAAAISAKPGGKKSAETEAF